MDWLLEPLSQSFMIRALIAGTIVGGLCATLGVFVVQRGLSFLGDGLAHAAFGGIALGLLIGVAVDRATWVALPFTIAIALGIAWVLRRGKLRGDVAVGVFFSVSFALGVLFLGLRPNDAPPVNVETVLFGSILAISTNDLWVVAGVAIASGLVLAATWSRLAFATFDPELAAIAGVPVAALDSMLLALVAVVIVVAVKTVGIALVSSFIVIPAATARMLGRTLPGVAAYALALGIGGAALGLLLSYHLNVASGATIILTLGGLFGVVLLAKRR
ncbi:metal ABC transporter permease [Sandaracinus amylolyticus]|uniref:metal ABC transporter permease n=1 Tax=Sandaracinus amylolyticus TaxID=927083 RepID=UPI001F34C8F2|nr:metal ABC transporter permease [Sandaracinus amylolyticus]UJR81903.1 High-affinity zinc uptake system membrane protein ZnuB [Sandaracinus amylolyticus]